MHEIVVNLHMHTRYSDGSGSHGDIARAALRAGLDAVIVTDHNVLVQGFEGYVHEGKQRVLLLVGQEIHDQDRTPQKNHLLALGAGRDCSEAADSPQALIDAVREAGGLAFLAHPDDPAAPAFHETDISWEDWSVHDYTGLEVWNALSEFKTVLPTRLHGLFFALLPQLIARAPLAATLRRWDQLLAGRRTVGIGGSDAHALPMQMGPLHRVVFPYEFHFRTVNTHVLLREPLSGSLPVDRQAVYAALAAGHCYVGYDYFLSSAGFRFSAQGHETEVVMGDEIPARGGVTLQARAPAMAELRLLKDGQVVARQTNRQVLTYITTQPGVYRLEAYRRALGLRRGWIFSNPIYVR